MCLHRSDRAVGHLVQLTRLGERGVEVPRPRFGCHAHEPRWRRQARQPHRGRHQDPEPRLDEVSAVAGAPQSFRRADAPAEVVANPTVERTEGRGSSRSTYSLRSSVSGTIAPGRLRVNAPRWTTTAFARCTATTSVGCKRKASPASSRSSTRGSASAEGHRGRAPGGISDVVVWAAQKVSYWM